MSLGWHRSFSNDGARVERRVRRRRGVALVAALAATGSTVLAAPSAHGHPPSDPLHGGSGKGVAVVGHTNLGIAELAAPGLNADVAVLDNHAYVGFGTNGGFSSQWNKAPRCKSAASEINANTVKVVSLVNPANPTVVAEIPIANRSTMARAVAALRVRNLSTANGAFTGDLLAIAREACAIARAGIPGLDLYDVTNPATPVLLSHVDRFWATRDVSLVQRPDGRVFALEAHQGNNVDGGIFVSDVSDPRAPQEIASFSQSRVNFLTKQECRPFSFAQGVTPNAAGTKAYGAYGDEGVLVFDTANPAGDLTVTGSAKYGATEEGNSASFTPNASETLALATDEDLNPAKTTITFNGGSASLITEPGAATAGVFRACEALWGLPLFRQATPSLTADVTYAGLGCTTVDYLGLDVAGKIVVVDRGGAISASPGGAGNPCTFDDKARIGQAAGAAAVLVANVVTDHHGSGTGVLFAPDSASPGDAGVTIPVAMVTKELKEAVVGALNQGQTVNATMADNADTWGALRVFNLSGTSPTQVATVNTEHSRVLTPGDGLYHAVQSIWEGNNALVAWMSDGLRVVDLAVPSTPKHRAFYVPPPAADPTGNYSAVPLVVSVAKFGSRFVITDVNGGLYVLDVVLAKDQCKLGGWTKFGFPNQGECVNLFDT